MKQRYRAIWNILYTTAPLNTHKYIIGQYYYVEVINQYIISWEDLDRFIQFMKTRNG